jgi:hypothetical protein
MCQRADDHASGGMYTQVQTTPSDQMIEIDVLQSMGCNPICLSCWLELACQGTNHRARASATLNDGGGEPESQTRTFSPSVEVADWV